MNWKWIVIRTVLVGLTVACFWNIVHQYEFFEDRSKLLERKIDALTTDPKAQYSDALELAEERLASHDARAPLFAGNLAMPIFFLLVLFTLSWWLDRVERKERAADNPEEPLRVEGIDHAELNVPDRFKAAGWYNATLGFNIMSEYKEWSNDPQGPLMISCDDGATKLALFEGEQKGTQQGVGFHLVAFRVDGQRFMRFTADHPEFASSVQDHGLAFSVYFKDPYGNDLEVTTYEHEVVRGGGRQFGADVA